VGGRGLGSNGEIIIDDTSFTNGCKATQSNQLPTGIRPPTTESPPRACANDKFHPNGFKCASDGICIEANKVCDFVSDCADGSDEAQCGTCDFEQSACGWYDATAADELKWTRSRAPSINPNGPAFDHTPNKTTRGYYMKTDLWTQSDWTIPGKLLGPEFQATGQYCKMRFWGNIGTTFNSNMLIYLSSVTDPSDYKLLANVIGDVSNNKDWKLYEVDVGESQPGYQIEIFAFPEYRSTASYDDIAIDDVKFENCYPDAIEFTETVSCDFEQSLCSYGIEAKDPVKWTRNANKSNSFRPTGPSGDHTTGNGYYALFRSTSNFPYNQKGNYDNLCF
jgi:hypothetical protein